MATAQDIFSFRSRFSELVAGDPDIAGVLNTADVFLDGTEWNAKDFRLARLLWAAHLLTMKQQASAVATIAGPEFAGGVASDLYIGSVSFGERSVSFQRRTGNMQIEGTGVGAGESMLSSTVYGQLFLQLRSRNFPAVAIV